MIERVLVATDGSDNARRAEAVGNELAAAIGANLVIAHSVVDRPSDDEIGGIAEVISGLGPQPFAPLHMDNLVEQVTQATGADHIRTHHDALRELGEHLLRRAAERAREAGVANVETRLLYGDPAEGVAEAARQEAVDLIVVGTHGIGGLRGRLRGSVSEKLLNQTEASTLVVKQ